MELRRKWPQCDRAVADACGLHEWRGLDELDVALWLAGFLDRYAGESEELKKMKKDEAPSEDKISFLQSEGDSYESPLSSIERVAF